MEKYAPDGMCPCCGKYKLPTVGDYDICHVCGWEDDPFQGEKPDSIYGANKMSLNEARKAYAKGEMVYDLDD